MRVENASGSRPADAGRLAVLGGVVVTMNAAGDVHFGGGVVVEGGSVAEVLTPGEAAAYVPTGDTRVLDATGLAVLPGLVDLHCHTAIERGGHTEALDLETALYRHWYPVMRNLDPDTAYRCALAMYAEQLRGGTTTVNDMFRHVEACAAAAEKVGIRAAFSSLVASDDAGLDTLEDNAAAYRAVHGSAGGRVSVHVGIEWLPLADEALLTGARELADELGTGIHLHLSESLGELEACRERYGRRPVEVAHELGLLGRDCVAAHCVWLTDREIAVLRDTGTSVSHNPTANAKMGEGIARVRELLDAGVTVGLGHDSTEGNNTLDLFDVMRTAAYLQRASRVDAAALSAPEVLTMATVNGARALGIDGGVLAPGKVADLCLVDVRADLFDPERPAYRRNLPARLAFSTNGSRVRTVVVDGEVVVLDGVLQTVDEAEATAEARRAIGALVDRLGLEDGA